MLLRHIVEDLLRLEADHLLEVFTVFQDILRLIDDREEASLVAILV